MEGTESPESAVKLWETLERPWQAAFHEAWESWRSGNFGIGAVLVDPETQKIVATGRNRVAQPEPRPRMLTGNMTAHAEMNAFAALDRFNAQGLYHVEHEANGAHHRRKAPFSACLFNCADQ